MRRIAKKFVRTHIACFAAAILLAGSAQAGSGASGLRDELRLGDLEISLRAKTTHDVLAERPSHGSGGSWNDVYSLSGKLTAESPLTVKFNANIIDRRRREGEKLDAARLGSFDARERRTVGDASLKFGLFGDRLKLRSRLGWSRSLEPPSHLGTLAAATLTALEDLESNNGKMDFAIFQRLDATVWRSEHFKVAAFGAWGRVGEDFRTLRKSNQGKKGFFGRPNRRLLQGGAKLRAGPLKLALSNSEFTYDIHLESEKQRGSTVNKAEMQFSLDEVASLLGRKPQKGAFRWMPSTVTLATAQGEIEPYADAEETDAVTDTNVGLWWNRDQWSAGANVWRSLWDSRQPYAEDADWASSGADLSFSYYGDHWDVSATAGVGRYLNEDEFSRSAELNLQGSLTMAVRPEWFPDLSGTVSLNRTNTDYIVYETASFSDYWEVSGAVDFSKYLRKRGDHKNSLRLIYSFSQWSADDGFDYLSQSTDLAILLDLGFAF